MNTHIPYYRQKTSYSCGAACLRMLCSLAGKRRSEQWLCRALQTSMQNGTRRTMMSLIGKQLFSATTIRAATWKDFLRALQNDSLLIVNYREPASEEGHYAIVTGRTADVIILHDPWNGPFFELTLRDFKSRWMGHKQKDTKHGWMMVVKVS